ncbi:MAG TPA: DNA polymerase ligase N-terminal domain-containing protein [Solirubrobacteraceae bacterium]|nr:DNA polymerase ligase N-terminal domain-containing protein [Solirubrobacteraceae bacterium]
MRDYAVSVPGDPTFVIHKHDARRLHYDLRLEVDGVLRSWAVPRGPSLDPADKRLAVEVDDHAMDYAGFEGVIGAGAAGSGAVIVWDRGTYRPLTEGPSSAALQRGHLAFWLRGQKLRGGFALQRLRTGERTPQWILVKMRDEHADPASDLVSERPESVVSGLTIEEMA